MEIRQIHNSPKFEARLVVKKDGFVNLGKDLLDTVEIGARTAGAVGSTAVETTILPSDIAQGGTFALRIKNQLVKMWERVSEIFGRNIKTSELEGVDLAKVADQTALPSSGVTAISTGVGSYDMALGSAIDQSVNYPLESVYTREVADMIANHLPKSVVNHLANVEHSAYDLLWDPRAGYGNECASCFSSVTSTVGGAFQAFGYTLTKEGNSAIRKVPS